LFLIQTIVYPGQDVLEKLKIVEIREEIADFDKDISSISDT